MARVGSSLALRLTIWFLLLSILPLAVTALFVRHDVSDAFAGFAALEQAQHVANTLGRLDLVRQREQAEAELRWFGRHSGVIGVVDERGRYVLHSGSAKPGSPAGADIPRLSVPDVLVENRAGTTTDILGRSVGYAVITGRPLVVTVAQLPHASTVRECLAALSQRTLLKLAASLLLVSLAGGTMIWVLVGNPLRSLTRAAEQVGRGELDVRVDPDEMDDELELLAHTFNTMTGRVRELVGGLEEHVRQLETAQTALSESERRFRELLETVRLGAVMLDAEGRVTFCNEHLLTLLGHRADEVLGACWHSRFVAPADQSAVVEVLDEALRTGAIASHYEHAVVAADGQARQLVWDNTVLRGPDGAVVGLASLGRDVTEQRELEAKLRQAGRMEAVGRLAGGVAHDFNNLLTSVLGQTELLLANPRLAPGFGEIAEIRRAAERGSRLTRSLLAFSRRQVLQPTVLRLEAVVGDMEKMLRQLIGEDVDLRLNLADGLPWLKVDRGQLEQVLLNLVVNARDAMPQGGRLELDAAPAEWAGREGLELRVSDSGCGMDAETAAKAFEPFFTTKAVSEGTGLGLSTVYGIVRQSDGRVQLDSEPGQGTTVRIWLPATYEPPTPEVPVAPPPELALGRTPRRGGPKLTVLLAEDDDQVRTTVQCVLEMAGYRVLAAETPSAALALLQEHGDRIALLLSDVVMPQMSGPALVEQVRLLRPDMRVLFMSGYAADQLSSAGGLRHDEAFLPKPFSVAELLAHVQALVEPTAAEVS